MSHKRDHIIIGSGKATVSFGTEEESVPKDSKIQVRHLAIALVVIGLCAGILIGATF